MASAYWIKVRTATTLDPAQFDRKRAAVRRLVEYLFSQGRHTVVFKGKWYLPFLTSELSRVARGTPFNKRATDAGLMGAIANTIDYSGSWAGPFVKKVETAISYLA
jgi:hypothetical protein